MKPHGALYHMAGRNAELAEAFVRGVHAYDASLFIYGQWGSVLLAEADRQGLPRAWRFSRTAPIGRTEH